MRTVYPLIRWGNLLLLRASIQGQQDLRVLQLLIDTGSSFTVLPLDVLTEIGCAPDLSGRRVSVVAAGGMIQAPRAVVTRFHCLGFEMEDFRVVALELPTSSPAAGLLGMDFLTQVGAVIDIQRREITLP
jgi:predicted aspartyl protease